MPVSNIQRKREQRGDSYQAWAFCNGRGIQQTPTTKSEDAKTERQAIEFIRPS